jgi:hypothetical protein
MKLNLYIIKKRFQSLLKLFNWKNINQEMSTKYTVYLLYLEKED